MRLGTVAKGVEVLGPLSGRGAEALSPDALDFAARLHRRFNPTREALLKERAGRQARLDGGEMPEFLAETKDVREATWKVGPPPADLEDRRVEITGPVDRKMMINALNSGARVFMADFEDAFSPTWANYVQGHVNLVDAVNRTLELSVDGKEYRLREKVATLVVRPRGWHLPEKHVQVDGKTISGSLLDFALYLHANAKGLAARRTGPYFYLPKMESHHEALLWAEVFREAESQLNLRRGTIKCTVLVETVLAAFEMEEILHALRDHGCALNAGRWDYIFSVIKKFRAHRSFVLPDRAQVTMTVPFMRAYTELLVKTCHARGAHAMGGMSAHIPSRKDPGVNERALEQVRADKVREARDGFDGTWVAHPDLVPVAAAEFDRVLGTRPHQVSKRRDDVRVAAKDLLDVRVPGGQVTEAGLRQNVSVGLQYIESWLRGVGAAAIHDLMEDAATAEIARSQVWQWVAHQVPLGGGAITRDRVRRVIDEELAALRAAQPAAFAKGAWGTARELFERVALAETFPEFLTLPAYERID